MDFPRSLNLANALSKRSAFLFGARGTGKTSLIRAQLPKARVYDLLDQRVYLRLLRDMHVLEQDNPRENSLIVIDEIQKLPELLDEVQRLITAKKHRFLLTGSSARKFKRQGVNLLGGRARLLHLYPLTWHELGTSFDLLRYLNQGGLPDIYLSEEPIDDLQGYIGLYLREEVAAEALSRRMDQFARFLDTVALNNGEELHLENLASDAGIKSRTLSNYIEILEDTLLGFRVPPYTMAKNRKVITRCKFYLFDVGVTRLLAGRGAVVPKSELFGRAFEHFIAMELRAALRYLKIDLPLYYWRTRSGFEVDFVLGDRVAIEVKSSDFVTAKHIKGLQALHADAPGLKHRLVISLDRHERLLNGVRIVPWEQALQELWGKAWFTDA
jgi:predicted AAA+ superfamily ATPase